MPIVASDWSVTRSSKNIRYIGDDHSGGAPSYARVIELHRWLSDLGDDSVFAGNDEYDITDVDASARSTDNIVTLVNSYNVDANAIEHLYDGTIIQSNGDERWDGLVNFGATSNIQILQNGALIADDWWNYGGGRNPDSTQGISHRFLIKVRTGGADIDGRRLIGMSREFNQQYKEFKIAGTSQGNNTLAIDTPSDLNNQTASATVATWSDITNLSAGYNGIDVNNDTTDEFYYSEWDRASRTISQMYERMKYLTRRGETTTLYGLQGQIFRGITHEIDIDTPTGTFNAFEAVSWSGGTGQMLAINSPTAGTKMWIQLLTGIAPTNNQLITGGTSGATCLVNVTVTEKSIAQPFCGLSTGAAIIGAFGFGVQATDLTTADQVTALSGTTYSPPNFQSGTISGLVVGEDNIIVTNNDAGNIDYDQFTLNGALSGAAVTSVVVNGSIPSDTPNSGTIRILRADGKYTKHAYSAWSGSTFTIASTDFSTNNAANGANCFISYIDKVATSTSESFTAVYSSNRTMFIRVRDGGVTPIKTFETTAVFGSGGFSVTASRITDS